LDAIILADLYNSQQDGFFSAYFHGRKHSDLQFFVKPRGAIPSLSPEEVAVINLDPGGEQSGIWYLSHRAAEFDNGKASSEEDKRVVSATDYKIETVIGSNQRFNATATISLEAVNPGDRIIPFDLLPTLRVTRVSLAGQDVPFIQENRKEDAGFYVVLPQPLV